MKARLDFLVPPGFGTATPPTAACCPRYLPAADAAPEIAGGFAQLLERAGEFLARAARSGLQAAAQSRQ